jgi:hypothetical protein
MRTNVRARYIPDKPQCPLHEELAYILDTLPIVRRKDEEWWGEYRTKRWVLEQHKVLQGMFDSTAWKL